jgi:1-aminocyclopropane-1-carboxylate deaminase
MLDHFYPPTPFHLVQHSYLKEKGVELWVKRSDMSHPHYGGNKMLKLWPWINMVREGMPITGIVSMGGVHSNHLYALSAWCNEAKLPLVAIVRDTISKNQSWIIEQIVQNKGVIQLSTREEYRLWRENGGEMCARVFPEQTWVPEGGSSEISNPAFDRFVVQWESQGLLDFDMLVIPAGTGGTANGILKSTKFNKSIWVVNAVPGFPMHEHLKNWLTDSWDEQRMHVIGTSEYGKFGRVSDSLYQFTYNWQQKTKVPIEPVYLARVIGVIWTAIERGEIRPGMRVAMLHTGGLAGAMSWSVQNKKAFIPPGIHPGME